MNKNTNCERIERLIFCLDEYPEASGLNEQEQNEVETHLQICESCRKIREEDRKLTLLFSGSDVSAAGHNIRKPETSAGKLNHSVKFEKFRISTTVFATAAALVVGFAFWQVGKFAFPPKDDGAALTFQKLPYEYGSIISKPVITNAVFTSPSESETESKSLGLTNHVSLPAGTATMIELKETGRINAIGPATFEIDRMENGWKVTLLKGDLKITRKGSLSIRVAGESGVHSLDSGLYVVSTSAVSFIQRVDGPNTKGEENVQKEQDQEQGEVEKLLEKGLEVFAADSKPTKEEYIKAAEMLVKVLKSKDAIQQQKMAAGFYAVAALSNAGKPKEVIKVGTLWEKSFKGKMGELVPTMIVKAHYVLGNHELARAQAKKILKEYPDSVYKTILESVGNSPLENESANGSLSGRSRRMPPANKPPYTSAKESQNFIAGQKNGYLVVNVGLDTRNERRAKFNAVSRRVQKFHKADSIEFTGKDFQELRRQIARHKPANVLFVIPPELLDVNFHRKVFQISPTLDNDLFVDFAWGYLTARDGEVLEKFWSRIETLHKNGLANKNWLETGVFGGEQKSYSIKGDIPAPAKTAGFNGDQLYFGCFEKDPNVIGFINSKKNQFENASIIAMTGNGDPQGIWLFDDRRNANSELHWKFEKSKVGKDPKNEMLRLKADWFRKLKLQSPIIWSGTCHSGACRRVYVEGDIVSTFGTSDKTEIYDLPPDESLCLSLIEGGAGSLLVPIAANHGLAVSMETDFFLKYGATLGETIKSTYDDAILQAGGVPKLLIVKQGDPHNYFGEPVMQSGAANRILIGDPALSLVKPAKIPNEKQTIKFDKAGNSLKVELDWQKGYHPSSWNLFSDGREFGYRMKTRIDCTDFPKLVAASRANSMKVHASIVDAKGQKIKCITRAQIETFGGKSFLYLEAGANKSDLPHRQHKATFDVTWK